MTQVSLSIAHNMLPTSGAKNTTDEELILRAQHGDDEAFGDLYERYLGSIYNYIFYRITNEQESEDLTELVFIKAWRALEKYQMTGAPFLAWLYRIARHVVADFHRNKKAKLVSLENHVGLRDGRVAPEDNAAAQGEWERVVQMLNQLPQVQQEVLTLRFLAGLSHDETAAALDRSPQSVRVIQHRALHALRLRLIDSTSDSA